jgi:FAD/FMN-containing dehydrogenase
MDGITFATTGSGTTTIDPARLKAFRGELQGNVLEAGAAGYDEARTIWNAMIDRRPGLIVHCASAQDAVHTVRFARAHGLLIAVRGGGHNIMGSAVCDQGLVIDMSRMRLVRVDAHARKAWVEPGATLADVDAATQAFGLAVPTGINSTTGIAGLTLGGGFGWLTRKYGLTIDSLVSAEVVTADGTLAHASAQENQDLFWALRGGGGNFGVVTSFEFHLSPAGPEVFSGLVVHALSDAPAVLKEYQRVLQHAPDELTCWGVMRQAPPLPFVPTPWHGKEVLVLAMCYCGDVANGERATASLRAIGNPIAVHTGSNPYAGWQQAFDPLLTPGARNYWKSHDLIELSDAAIAMLAGAAGRLPGPECEIFIAHVGGAAGRISADATAFVQRKSHFIMNVHARWRNENMDQACISWARKLFAEMSPHATGTAYVNFMPDDEGDRVKAIYGDNYRRLAEVKRRYDPSNLLRMNRNIMPLEG